MDKTLTPQEALGELSDMREDFVEMLGRIAVAQEQLGRAYDYAQSKRLAQVAGFKNAWDYFSRHFKGLTREALDSYSSMTFHWKPEAIRHYGMDRLRVLSSYLWLHGPSHMGPPDPGVFLIRVPQPDGTLATKTFAECRLEEVQRALRPKPAPAPRGRPSPTDSVRLLFLRDRLARYFEGLAEIRVDMRTEPDGRSFLTVQGIPMRELRRFLWAFQEGLGAQPLAVRAEKKTAA
jgi:hypothetical protein